MRRLDGRCALITDAARGIGKAFAVDLDVTGQDSIVKAVAKMVVLLTISESDYVIAETFKVDVGNWMR